MGDWRPGRHAIFAWAGVMALLAGAGWQPVLFWVACAAALLLFGLTLYDARRLLQDGKPSLGRQHPAIVPRGEAFQVSLIVQQDGALPLHLQLREDLPDSARPRLWQTALLLQPSTSTPANYTITLPMRGQYDLGPSHAWCATPWRLAERRILLGEATSIKSFPESVARPEGFQEHLAAASQMEQRARSRRRGEGMEFETLSAYQPGDDPRHVDWKVSARARELMVRRYRIEMHRQVMICIDAGRLMGAETVHGSKLDRAVDAGLMLSRTALAKGDQCGMAVFDSQVHGFLPPKSGAHAWRAILEYTYAAASRFQESDFECVFNALQQRQQKRALIVVLSDISDEATSFKLSAGLVALARRHVLVFCALRTPRLAAYLEDPILAPRDVARKAVAMTLMRDRERALHVLTRAGVHVLDVEPRDVTIPLINQYLRIRHGGEL